MATQMLSRQLTEPVGRKLIFREATAPSGALAGPPEQHHPVVQVPVNQSQEIAFPHCQPRRQSRLSWKKDQERSAELLADVTVPRGMVPSEK